MVFTGAYDVTGPTPMALQAPQSAAQSPHLVFGMGELRKQRKRLTGDASRAGDQSQEGDGQETDQPVTRTPPPDISGGLGPLREALHRLSLKIFENAVCGEPTRNLLQRRAFLADHDKRCPEYPLSPLIGAFFLNELDERMERLGLFYVRFMDDILVLAPTRMETYCVPLSL